MNIQEFAAEITGENGIFAGNELRKELTFKIIEKHLNNDGHLTGLCITRAGNNMSPAIYLDPFLDQYNEAGETDEAMRAVLEKLENMYFEATENVNFIFDAKEVCNFEKAKENVFPKLVNKKLNEAWLDTMPHLDFGNLAITFYVKVGEIKDAEGSIQVTDEILKGWKTSLEELFDLSIKNFEKDIEFSPILNLLLSHAHKTIEELEFAFPGIAEATAALPMDVATLKSYNLGAAAMLSKSFLKSYSEKKGSAWIIPSSVHEIILIPEAAGVEPLYLAQLIKEVNSHEVAPDEVLSNELYYYNAEDNEIHNGLTGEKMEVSVA